MNPTTQLDLAPHDPGLAPSISKPTLAQVLHSALERGVTMENAAVVKELLAIHERMEDRQAEKDFATAFVALQAEMPKIQAVQPVPNNDGTTRYKFAPLPYIMEQISPSMQRHGFSVHFSCEYRDDKIIQTCTLQHISGHKRTNQFIARVGNGPPKSTATQADGAAATYAQRQALCNALNIVVARDNDGGASEDMKGDGEFIDAAKIQYLREQIKESGATEASYLELAGAKTFEEIGSGTYPVLIRAIEIRKRKAGR